MPSQAFQQALERQQEKIEPYTVQFFKRLGKESWLNPRQDYEGKKICDLYVKDPTGFPVPIEVKEDLMSVATGNVALEPRALETSLSHHVLYWIPHLYLLEMPTARFMARHAPEFKPGGEFNEDLGIYPRQDFFKQAKRIL